MRKLICIISAIFLLTACSPTKDYYTANGDSLCAVVNLHCNLDYEERLETALSDYDLNFAKEELVTIGEITENQGRDAFLVIPRNENVSVTIDNEYIRQQQINTPALIFTHGNVELTIEADRQYYTAVFNPYGMEIEGEKAEFISGINIFDKQLFENDEVFINKATELGYAQEQLDELADFFADGISNKYFRYFVLSYGDRLTSEYHYCYEPVQVTSPGDKYTINWYSYEMYNGMLVLTDNQTGKKSIVHKDYWSDSQSLPQFIGEDKIVAFGYDSVALSAIDNVAAPEKFFRIEDTENYHLSDVYYNRRDNNIIVSWCHKPGFDDWGREGAQYKYNFTIFDTEGNEIKTLESDLGVHWGNNHICEPDFYPVREQTESGKLIFDYWKNGTFILDLETGLAEKISE